MPAAFPTWTVLDHGPLEKLNDNLWCIVVMHGANIEESAAQTLRTVAAGL